MWDAEWPWWGRLLRAEPSGNYCPLWTSQAADQIKRLYDLFLKVDATQVEVNPLGETPEGQGTLYHKKNACLSVWVCVSVCVWTWSLSFSVYYLYLCSPLHVCFYLLLAVLKSRQACVIFQNSALLHEQAATLLSGTVGFISSGLNAFKNVECNCNTLTSVSCQHDSVWIKIQMASGIRAFHIHSMLMFVHGS